MPSPCAWRGTGAGGRLPHSLEVRDATGRVAGRLNLTGWVGTSALDGPDPRRDCPDLLRRRNPNPAADAFPAELSLSYTVTPYSPRPARQEPPLELPLLLPAATPPAQTRSLPRRASPCPVHARRRYSSTTPRRQALWLEFTALVTDPATSTFVRSWPTLRPDADRRAVRRTRRCHPAPAAAGHRSELIPRWCPATDDHAGVSAMQPLLPSARLPLHAPPPAGLAVDAPELSGFFVYELRAGHQSSWSTAQGRFGPPLRVAGVQLPAPPLLSVVSSLPRRSASARRTPRRRSPGEACAVPARRAVGPAVRVGDPGRQHERSATCCWPAAA